MKGQVPLTGTFLARIEIGPGLAGGQTKSTGAFQIFQIGYIREQSPSKEMSNLPETLREKLSGDGSLFSSLAVGKDPGGDGTVKITLKT